MKCSDTRLLEVDIGRSCPYGVSEYAPHPINGHTEGPGKLGIKQVRGLCMARNVSRRQEVKG
jgi:hypothetical protein